METSPPVGERLRRARTIVTDLTAAELSTLAGLSSAHVGMIERRDVKDPSSSVLAKLATCLGVSMEWLALGSGPEPTSDQVRAAVERARAAVAPDPAPAER